MTMWKNMVEPERPQVAIWRGVACWISKATRAQAPTTTHTHTQKYAILIASPQQQWFSERASLLRYTYVACRVDS